VRKPFNVYAGFEYGIQGRSHDTPPPPGAVKSAEVQIQMSAETQFSHPCAAYFRSPP